jgi:hypothetical protein
MPAREPLDVEDRLRKAMDVDEDSDCDADWVSGETVRKAAEQRSMKRRKRKNVPQRSQMPMTQRGIFSYLAEQQAQETAEAEAKEMRALRLATEAAETAAAAAAAAATAVKAASVAAEAAARATLAVRAAWGGKC